MLNQKIGLEFEFPMVNSIGECASYNDDLRLWKEWKKLGYEYKYDPHTKKIVGAYKQFQNGKREVGTDYCTGTFEVAMPPEKNLKAARKVWKKFLSEECLPILKRNELRILGYASQPKSRHLKNKMAPKGHYQIWNQLLAANCAEWIRDKGSGFAAAQYNIDVPFKQITEVTNALTKITCVVWALSMNDPVSNSEVTRFKSTRLRVYESIVKGGGFKNRGSFPDDEYKSVEDYIDKAWSKPIFEIIRAGKSLKPLRRSLTTWSFIKKKRAVFVDLAGNQSEFQIIPEDLALGIYFYWPAVRIKMFFNDECSVDRIVAAVKKGQVKKVLSAEGSSCFIEIRPVATAPQEELFAWPAFFIGLIENRSQLEKITKGWSMKDLEALIPSIQRYGLATKWKGKSLNKHGKDIISVAKSGLEKKHKGLVSWLAPLEARQALGLSPADKAKRVYEKEGMNQLVDYLAIK